MGHDLAELTFKTMLYFMVVKMKFSLKTFDSNIKNAHKIWLCIKKEKLSYYYYVRNTGCKCRMDFKVLGS
jgi:hypothetical protein